MHLRNRNYVKYYKVCIQFGRSDRAGGRRRRRWCRRTHPVWGERAHGHSAVLSGARRGAQQSRRLTLQQGQEAHLLTALLFSTPLSLFLSRSFEFPFDSCFILPWYIVMLCIKWKQIQWLIIYSLLIPEFLRCN